MYIASMTDGSLINLMFALMFCQQQLSVIYVNWQSPKDSNSFNGLSTISTDSMSFTKFNEHELNVQTFQW